jgi:hypothetical protein
MDEETKKLLEENLTLNKENNQMLTKLVLYQKWNQIYRIAYWAIIILSTLGAFYFLQPYLSSLIGVYTGGAGVSNISDIGKTLGDKSQMQDLIKSLNAN